MNKDKLIYSISTVLLSIMLLLGAFAFIADFEGTSEKFEHLGVGSFFIYPLALAKILAVLAIATRKIPALVLLAYAGLGITFLLAIFHHIKAGDGITGAGGAIFALLFLGLSYFFGQKINRV